MVDVGPAAPPPLLVATPKRKRGQLSQNDNSPRTATTPNISSRSTSSSPTTISTDNAFTFEVPAHDGDDGSSSPRTRVARKFQGLALDAHSSGAAAGRASTGAAAGGVTVASASLLAGTARTHRAGSPSPRRGTAADAAMHCGGAGSAAENYNDGDGDDGDGSIARKRFKLPEPRNDASAPPSHASSVFAPTADVARPLGMVDWAAQLWGSGVGGAAQGGDSAKRGSSATFASGAHKTHHRHHTTIMSPLTAADKEAMRRPPAPPRLAGISSRNGTKTTAADGGEEEDEEEENGGFYLSSSSSQKEIVDPIRAALTWHEDEITVYDPDDEDDDGTGINGIGFKPTPAVAYARTLKRRQQLIEYRKREERDARARRNQRRRTGSPAILGGGTAGAGVAGAGGAVATGAGVAKSSRREQLAARRVRFMDLEPAAIVTT